MQLAKEPTTTNTLDVSETERVTLIRDDYERVFLFASFDPRTLRTRWVQRAPGSFDDPRGHRDHNGREGLWRAQLDRNYRDLLDRFVPADVVDVLP